jgi:hypothetical protein
MEKQERTIRSKREEKAAAEAVANNVILHCVSTNRKMLILTQVKLAFMDDRKTKLTRDQREKERREARAAVAAALPAVQSPSPPTIQGSGYVLATGALEDGQYDHEMSSPASSPPPPSRRRMPGSGHILVTADDSATVPPPYDEDSD